MARYKWDHCGHARHHESIRGLVKCYVAWSQKRDRHEGKGQTPLRSPGGTLVFCRSDGSSLTPEEKAVLHHLMDKYERHGTF